MGSGFIVARPVGKHPLRRAQAPRNSATPVQQRSPSVRLCVKSERFVTSGHTSRIESPLYGPEIGNAGLF